jgi:sulfur carrier protein ThiS
LITGGLCSIRLREACLAINLVALAVDESKLKEEHWKIGEIGLADRVKVVPTIAGK